MAIQTSILLVNYNGSIFLEDCIRSIHAGFKGLSYEILLLDNASKDDSLALLQTRFPEVIVIKSEENLGFAKGNNRAFQEAKGTYILLLNTDTILLSHLSPAIQALEKDEGIGIVGIKMVDKQHKYRKSAGHFPSPKRLLRLKRLYVTENGFENGNFHETHYEVDWIEGSFLLTSRAIYERVGGLSEDYFMYVEDVDFCKKVALLNKKRVYLPQLHYIHYGGFNSSKEQLLKDGLILYCRKFLKGIKKIMAIIAIKLNHAIKQKYAEKTTS